MTADRNAAAAASPYQVQVLDRAAAILDLLAAEGDGLSLLELSSRLSLHKSTVHRVLMVLERHRFVEKGPSAHYGLGLKLFELGQRAVGRLGIGERARPYLEGLAAAGGETAHLCVLDEGEVLYLEKVEPLRTVRVPSSVGRRNPAHCTAVGKALLAFLPETSVDEILRRRGMEKRTRNTVGSVAELKRELALVRTRGFAVDDEEIEEGLKCIGAPVRDSTGSVVASLSIAGPAFRMTKAKLPGLARLVVDAADRLSRELGHRERPASSR